MNNDMVLTIEDIFALETITLCDIILRRDIKMRIFKVKNFSNWAIAEKIENKKLTQAIQELGQGLFDAHLGSGLYKKRIARKGGGKRDGYRTLIAFQCDNKAIFMHGFAKNELDNICQKEKYVLKKLAKYYLNVTEKEINKLLKAIELIEVK